MDLTFLHTMSLRSALCSALSQCHANASVLFESALPPCSVSPLRFERAGLASNKTEGLDRRREKQLLQADRCESNAGSDVSGKLCQASREVIGSDERTHCALRDCLSARVCILQLGWAFIGFLGVSLFP